ncbi:Y-family DNA polymerase [Thalassotalea marina]|uniref:Nucleotidyltransferase n=1 Tax=Thalassotalea marina TaxID=1673741 RepID=A0A919BML3_9GAMM|nr:DNA polymerase Y family protein [Thalassotalea marina]GHG01464.1 nucleotidyltransferase [Thalassotalea marina]
MTLWLYLHFPSLQLDALFRQPDVGIKPLIIVDEKRNEVVQLSQLAIDEGIRVGMGLGSASSLCSELKVLPYQQQVESRLLKRIAHWLYSVTADIALYPPNGLLLRVSNMLTLHQNLNSYWQHLAQHLNRLALSYHYATGYSPYAARMLARQRLDHICADQHYLQQKIAEQPLICADLEPKVINHLAKVGVHCFDDLLSLSLPALSKRFNIEVVNYIGRLTGQLQHPVNFYIPPEHFEQYLELYYEVSNLQYLEKPLLKLYQLLDRYLRLKDKLAAEVLLVLHQRDSDDLSFSVTAAQGEYRADKWKQLTQLSLESIKLNAPVIAITLKVTRTLNKYAQRVDLFKGSQGSLSSSELVSILSAKLGKDKIKGLQIAHDDRPEVANQLTAPFSVQAKILKSELLRPSLLLPTPVPPTEAIQIVSCPERVVTGWWDDHPVVRDYFIGRSETGRWLWLFKDKNQQWFIHGMFS